MTVEQTVKEFALAVKAEGGRVLLVGGCVRDELLGITPKDIDCEVYHLAPEKLKEVVSRFGKVDAVGESFQVYKIGQDIDVSLPRREKKTGVGHKGFTVEGDPNMSFHEACSRRDFTINAIMKDPLTGEIVDPFEGREDILSKRLHIVSLKSFQEDSLRVLRLAQFASRLGFTPTDITADLARRTDLSDLPKERVWMELEKMFLKSPDVSIGINYLQELGISRKLFPSLERYSLQALHLVSFFVEGLTNEEKICVILAVLCRDSYFGDVLEELGVTSVNGYNVRETVDRLLMYGRVPATVDYQIYKQARNVNMKLASRVFYALGIPAAKDFASSIKRLGVENSPMKPLIQGRHLIELGLAPSPKFTEILKEAYDKQMHGEFRTTDEGMSIVKAML